MGQVHAEAGKDKVVWVNLGAALTIAEHKGGSRIAFRVGEEDEMIDVKETPETLLETFDEPKQRKKAKRAKKAKKSPRARKTKPLKKPSRPPIILRPPLDTCRFHRENRRIQRAAARYPEWMIAGRRAALGASPMSGPLQAAAKCHGRCGPTREN